MGVAAPGPSPLDGSLFLASATAGGGIRRLRPVPLDRQARLLAAAHDFSGALELCSRLPAGPRRRALEDSLRLRFCHHLFAAGDLDDALTQLSMCSDASPLLLLRLFPDLVPRKFRGLLPATAYGEPLPPVEESPAGLHQPAEAGDAATSSSDAAHGPDGRAAAAVGAVIPYLLSYRTRLLAAMEEQAAAAAAAASAAASGAGGARQQAAAGSDVKPGKAAPRRPRRPGQPAQPEPEPSPPPEAAPPPPPQAVAAPEAATSNKGDSSDSASGSSGPQPPNEVVATILDTALLLAMLAQPDSGALLRLLQQRNYVDPAEGEAALGAAGRYAELAALLQYTGQVGRLCFSHIAQSYTWTEGARIVRGSPSPLPKHPNLNTHATNPAATPETQTERQGS
jgi:hypothetical protein